MNAYKFFQMILYKSMRGSPAHLVGLKLPVAIGLATMFSLGCGQATSQEDTSQPVAVTTVRPERSFVSKSITLVGHVRPWKQAVLYSKVAGYLEWIGVDRGSWVKQDEVLAIIDDPETRKEYQQQKADTEAKRIIYERLLAAIERNPDMVSQLEVDRSKGECEAALAALERLQASCDFSKIRAPYDGVITDRWVDPGALIQVGTASQNLSARIVRIMSFDTVRVEVEIPEPDVPQIHRKQKAFVTLPEYPDQTFDGQVSRYSWAIDPSTRTMGAEVDIENFNHKLRPGMFTTVEIELQAGSDVLTLPSEVIVLEGDKRFVWIVSGGTARQVPVTLGNDSGIQVEILEGLDGSEAVLTTGHHLLNEGDEVTVVETSQL